MYQEDKQMNNSIENQFNYILKEHGIYGEDIESILYAVSDMLNYMADKTKEESPYAVNSIRDLEQAAYEVFDLTNYL